MKKCHFCFEEIQDEAIICKHCGKMLNSPENESDPLDNPSRKTSININKEMRIGDRYLIRAKLGEGGMGEVYLTEDAELEGAVRAVKVLPEKLTEDIKAVKRLKEEAQITMELNHNNIVRLFNYEKKEQTHYLVMEYVNGLDLNTYIGIKGKIGEASARRIGIELAEALGVAHSHQPPIIHRDVKPANILLEWSKLDIETISTLKKKGTEIAPEELPDIDTARVKLADFGIARQVRDSMSKYGRMSDTSGTKLYMSPEQIRGKGVDIRTDLYALGATLYELLSGDPPFGGESVEYQIFNEKPDPIEGISDEMNQILLCLLEKEKEKRYPNAEELILHFKGNGQSLSTGKQDQKGNIRGKDQEQDSSASIKDSVNVFGGNGYLSIKTSERCGIWIDGISVGETKDQAAVFMDIQSGKHVIEGRTRYRKALEELEFRKNDVKRTNLELKEVLCDLRAISDGIEYELTIDGKKYECPKLIEQIPAGKRTITIIIGDLSFEEEVDLFYDGIIEYNLTKEKIRIKQKIQDEENRKAEDDLWYAVKKKDKKETYEEYIKKYPKGRYIEEAQVIVEEILKKKNEQAIQYFKKGEEYREKGEYELAIENYSRAIELHPEDAIYYNNRGGALNTKGEHERAIEDYSKAIELEPGNALPYYNRGHAWEDRGEYDRATEDYSRAIDLAPEQDFLYHARAFVSYMRGNYDKALLDCSKAIEINPENVAAYNGRGFAWRAKGEYDRAIEDYSKAVDLSPNSASTYYFRGNTWYDKGEYDQAVKDYSRAIELNPKYITAYDSRGFAWKKKGDQEKADADFQMARTLEGE